MESLSAETLPALCPGPDRVLALVARTLSSEDRTTVERHVECCRACRKLMMSFEQTNAEDIVASGSDTAVTTIGRYRLEDKLGRGGMGTVYVAYDPQLDRRVALKLVRPEVADVGGAERLVREGRALAKLSHANVVAIHDAGVDGDRVYIVMQLVEGQNLASWLAARPRGIAQIVRMFVAAARGIAAAHRAGVIHRDVKPENILVDRADVAKVADFGLAGHVTYVSDDERLTLPNAVMGTPAFMSPEQRRGEEVGPATDQFSLCAALQRALDDAHRDRALPAWLADAIARGLAPLPRDRFASMDELVTALDVDARLRRLRRRRAMGVTAGVGAILMLGAFAVGRAPASGTDEARVACDAAKTAREAVWTRADRDAIARSLLATGKPFAVETVARLTKVGDRYAASLAQVEAHACEAAPRTEAARMQLSDGLQCLAERRDGFAAAIAKLRTASVTDARYAVSTILALAEPEDCGVPSYLVEERAANATPLGAATRSQVVRELALAKAAQSTGSPKDAVAHARRAVELARPSGGVLLARSLLGLGEVVHDTDGFDAVEAAYREAVAVSDTVGADHVRAHALVALMAATARIAGREKEALSLEPLVSAAIQRAGQQKELGPVLRRAIGIAKFQQWKTPAALEDLQAALTAARETIPPDDPRLTPYLLGVGLSLARVSRPEDASRTFDEAVRIATDAYGPLHPETARLAINRATVHAQLRDCDKALDELAKARATLEDVLPPASPEHVQIAQVMGACHYMLHHYDEALVEYQRRQNAMIAAGLGKSERMASSWIDLGDVELGRLRNAEAIAYYRRALTELEAVVGTTDTRVAMPLMRIGAAEVESGHPAAAVEYLDRAVTMLTSTGAPAVFVTDAQFYLAQALVRTKRDPARARTAAEAARVGYAAQGKTALREKAEAMLAQLAH